MHSPAFFQNLSRFFQCWLWLTHGSCVGPQNKIGHPAGVRFRVECQRNINKLIQIFFKRLVVCWLVKWITWRKSEVCVQPWCNPLWLTELKHQSANQQQPTCGAMAREWVHQSLPPSQHFSPLTLHFFHLTLSRSVLVVMRPLKHFLRVSDLSDCLLRTYVILSWKRYLHPLPPPTR